MYSLLSFSSFFFFSFRHDSIVEGEGVGMIFFQGVSRGRWYSLRKNKGEGFILKLMVFYLFSSISIDAFQCDKTFFSVCNPRL